MIIGYARVSTEDQKLNLQVQALEQAGCDMICEDLGQTGSHFGRTGLQNALSELNPGDTLVVWRLDRLGRSLSGLVKLVDELGHRQVHFQSVMEKIDTTSPGGRFMFHLMAALAEFERSIISERTRAGMAAAKADGRQLGRPAVLTPEQVHVAKKEIERGRASRKRIARELKVSPRTLQRHINKLTPHNPG